MLVWATEDVVDNIHMRLTVEEVQGLGRRAHATLQPECVSQHHKLPAD